MEHLGFYGIIQLSTQIILKYLKHFLRMALIFALPHALNLILLGPCFKSIQTLVASISLIYKLSASQGPLPPSDLTAYDEAIFTKQQPYPLSLLIFLFLFSVTISLICRPLVAFSVCRACIHKSLDLKGSLRGVSRSAINLVVTVLCVAAALIAFCAAATMVAAIIAVVLSAVNANLTIPMTIWTIGVLIGVVYMGVALSLADAVAIMEEKKGWEAMRRSVYLIKGSEGIAMGLYFVYGVLGNLLVPLVVCSVSKEFMVWALSVGLQALIALCSMAARVVLYMSCKSLHEEPLETLLPASSQFGPHEFSPKYLDLESAAFHSTAL